jgi:DNA polymerase-3 subunit epsilon
MALRPIYYDTETTGIKYDKERIIEIAAYDPVQNRTLEMLINPGVPIPAEATAIHKITDEMVKDALPFSEVGKKFIEFCEGEVVLIAHNNDNFDLPFMKCEFERNSLEFPQCKTLDSLKWARRYRPDLPKHPLQFLREIYGIPSNNAHRALDDVIVLHQIFSIMIDDLTMEQVIELLEKPKALQRMPFGKYQGQALKDVPSTYIQWLKSNGALDKPENLELKQNFEKIGLLSAVS